MRSTAPIPALARTGATLAALCLVIGAPSPAGAHVEPTSATGEAGRRADVGFVPTHGCGTAPTVGIDIQLPDDVLDPLPEDVDGWTTSVDDRVVTWDGGLLPDGDELAFSVNVLLPDAPGTTLFFPTIQRCPDGESLAWIQQPGDGTDQSYPAPAITVVDATGPPGTTTPPPPTTEATGPTTAADPAATTTTAPATTVVPSSTTVPEPTLVESESDSGGDSLVPVLLALIGVIGVAAGAIVLLRRRGAGEGTDAS